MQSRITLSFIAGMTSLAFSGEFELTPTADAEVRESNAMERRGDPSQGTWHTELSVRSNENKFSYIDFDLVPLAGKTIRSADLRLTVRHDGVWPSNAGGIRVYAFKSTPTWNEETIYYRNLALHDNAEPKRTLTDPDNAPGLSADYQKNWSPPPTFLPVNEVDTFDVKSDGVVLLGYMNYDKPTAERPALTGGAVISFTGSDHETGKPENEKNRESLVSLLNGMIKNNRGRVTFLITSKYEGDPGSVSRSNMVLASREFDPDASGPLRIGAWAPRLVIDTAE
jgi:hypothetical protein